MSLSSALGIAMSGLRANQAALTVTSSNVANAQTPGYVTRSVNQVEVSVADTGPTVAIDGVQRQIDTFVQAQLRNETSGAAYADQISNVLTQLQSVYGTPGQAGSLETSFDNFTSSVQSLSGDPGDPSAQSAVVNAAQSLAQQLNVTTNGIQSLRSNAEQDIATSVGQANTALSQIASINQQLQGLSPTDPAAATLMDQRDDAINQLAKLVDLRTSTGPNNQVSVYTTAGVQLVGGTVASQFSFDSQGTLNANTLFNSDPTKSGVGTLSLTLANGSSVDMTGTNAIRSGQIAADLQLRDNTLVQAQAQVDQMAATLSSSLSDTTTAGTAVNVGPQAGFTLDLSNVQPGNTISLNYTGAGNTQQQVTIVRVDDPAALPLPSGTPPNATGRVIGVNFSGGMSSVVLQLTAALGSQLQFSNPSGNTLQILGTGATTLNSASVTKTATSMTSGSPQLPLFSDGSTLFTGNVTAIGGAQQTGYAGRITVNPAVLANPSFLSIYSTSPPTQPGDTTRSDFIFSQLTNGTFNYSPQTGLGSTASPFNGTLTNYMQQFLGLQANAATAAQQLQQGQDVVLNTLQQKFTSTSGVNIDNEMANLIGLQNSYAANAHVMSVVQSLMTTLLQIQV